MQKIQCYGNRVILEELVEELEGNIQIPAVRNAQSYDIGKIVSVGDGKSYGKSEEMCGVKEGDVVLFQFNKTVQTFNSSYKIDNKPYLILNQGDLVAKLSSQKVDFNSFEILGRWILVDIVVSGISTTGILLPERLRESATDHTQYVISKIGECAKKCEHLKDLKVGDTVTVDRSRLNIVSIDSKQYAYIDLDFISGKYE